MRPATEVIGPLEIDVAESDLISDVIVLAVVVDAETGEVGLSVAASEGLSRIGQIGILRLAERIALDGFRITSDDD